MKKFWKNLCVCSCALISSMSLWACGKPAPEVSIDLDGDGAISAWETIFEVKEPSYRQLISSDMVVDVATLADLKAINNNTEENKIYNLVSDINCNGEEIAINLRGSQLLGNNHVIKNFKFGECLFSSDESTNSKSTHKGLIYNGVAVYDLRLFVGNQVFDQTANVDTVISPLINVSNIDNIEVRGRIGANIKPEGSVYQKTIDISLLNANTSVVAGEQGISVSNCKVLGKIDYTETSSMMIRIGSAMPHVEVGDSVYNVDSTVDIAVRPKGVLKVGAIVGQNDDFVSTCTANGSVKVVIEGNLNEPAQIGGVVGINNNTAEIKNCVANNSISIENALEQTLGNFEVGGVTATNFGIMNYVTSDAKIKLGNINTAFIGGIAAKSLDGILYNFLARGSIDCQKISDLKVAEVAGFSENGYISTGIASTNITIDNSTSGSKVYLGMVTIFEDLDIPEGAYNAVNSPNFNGILVGSKNTIYMKPSGSVFRYNLGLRNDYLAQAYDENGPKEEVSIGEDGENIYTPIKEPILPDQYDKLFYTTGHTIEKYNVEKDIKTLETLDITYAKNEGKQLKVSQVSSVRQNVTFFVVDLGLKYGLNHSEIDISSLDTSKFQYTLPKTYHMTKYFEKQSYNGELVGFDRYLDQECTFDNTDEMFSLLNNLFLSNTSETYMALKVSGNFVMSSFVDNSDDSVEEIPEDSVQEGESTDDSDETEDEEGSVDFEVEDSSLSARARFAAIVSRVIKNMFNIEITPEKKPANYINEYNTEQDVSLEEEDRYYELIFRSEKNIYTLRFDVNQLPYEEGSGMSEKELLNKDFVVYLEYSCKAKFVG